LGYTTLEDYRDPLYLWVINDLEMNPPPGEDRREAV
jgi:hypothetical protein